VRELKSEVEQALLLAAGDEIDVGDLFGDAAGAGTPVSHTDGTAAAANDGQSPGAQSFRDAKERAVETFERDFLLAALRRNGGNITQAALEVGMYRQNFQQKMRELGISAEETGKPGREPEREGEE
jgi:DNA-binding NtrC family response regulator